MQLEHLPPAQLKPHPLNSRVHPQSQLDQLAASYAEFGFNGLVVIDEADVILAGHGRTKAALQAGLETIPCKRVTGWPDEKKRAFVIADNQIADNSEWDTDLLLAELKALDDSGIDMALFGVDVDSLLPPGDPPTDQASMREAETHTDARRDPDEAAFQSEMADKRAPGLAPIVPMYAEHNQAFIILCDNEIDEAFIRQRLGLNVPHRSYTDVKELCPNIITVAQLRALLS